MARNINKIFKFLNNKEQIAETFKEIGNRCCIFVPTDIDVRAMELKRISNRETWIKKDTAKAKQSAKKVLSDLDSDFENAISGETNEAKREFYNKEYQEKRAVVAAGVEMVEAAADRALYNWNRFKQGETLTYNDVYGLIDQYSEITRRAVPRAAEKSYVVKQAVTGITANKQEGLSAEESQMLGQLIKDLEQISTELRTAEKGLMKQRFKGFETEIAECGALCIDSNSKNKDLKQAYFSKLAELRRQYEDVMAKYEKSDEVIEAQIYGDILNIINNRGDVNTLKESINKNKEAKKGIENAKASLDTQLKVFIKEAKQTLNADRASILPNKRSKFMLLLGTIRAKLGFGKNKVDKNVADSIQKAIQNIGSFARSVGEVVR